MPEPVVSGLNPVLKPGPQYLEKPTYDTTRRDKRNLENYREQRSQVDRIEADNRIREQGNAAHRTEANYKRESDKRALLAEKEKAQAQATVDKRLKDESSGRQTGNRVDVTG